MEHQDTTQRHWKREIQGERRDLQPQEEAQKELLNLSDGISIASFEEGFVVNKDGSLAVGFEITLFEEEELSPDRFMIFT